MRHCRRLRAQARWGLERANRRRVAPLQVGHSCVGRLLAPYGQRVPLLGRSSGARRRRPGHKCCLISASNCWKVRGPRITFRTNPSRSITNVVGRTGAGSGNSVAKPCSVLIGEVARNSVSTCRCDHDGDARSVVASHGAGLRRVHSELERQVPAGISNLWSSSRTIPLGAFAPPGIPRLRVGAPDRRTGN